MVAPAPRETPEEKAEREAELNRQRQQRYRDRQKVTQESTQTDNATESERENATLRYGVTPQFNLKLPFVHNDRHGGKPEKVKLFSIKEAEAELEKLTEVYRRGSSLLDDVLEIIVKDHEPVKIWELDEDEAETLAGMHLERAKVDEAAARSARKLLSIYDRLYFWLIVGPRAKATYSHVKTHKGFSFR